MLKSDRYYRNIQSQRNLDLTKNFKIRLPNSSTKRLSKYKSWRNFNSSIEKNDRGDKQNKGLEGLCENLSYLRFMKSFLKEKGQTTYQGRKTIEKLMHQKSTTGMTPQKSKQHHKTAVEQETYQTSCTIYLGQKKTPVQYKVSTVIDLISFLRGRKQDIITYRTVAKDLSLDYCLTLNQMDASFLNGTFVYLMPVFRQPQQSISLNSFEILTCIGTGGFSRVFLVRFLGDGKFYAMKVISKAFIIKNKKKNIVINERNIMKSLNSHPFLVKMKFSFQSRQSLIFVMEYCPGGQLFNLVKKFRRMKEDIAKFYIIETLLGLQKIHQENIIYRDFKPENILIDPEGHVRIADFGLSKPDINSNKDRATSFCGSPQYMPPEMILKRGHSFPVDYYCIGALLYQLVTGLPPFYNKDPNKIYQATISEMLTFPNHTALTSEIKELLLGLLEKDQKFRLGSLSGVREILAHPWFGKINRKQYMERKVKPPVNFSSIEDFNFTFDEIKNDNEKFVAELKRQQKDQNHQYQRIMNNFSYDYREIEGIQVQRNPIVLKGLGSVDSLNSTRQTKRRKSNALSTRSKTSNQKFRQSPLSMEAHMIYKTLKAF